VRNSYAELQGGLVDTVIAVLIPCFNEATTIPKVIMDFRRALPDATIFVYDNASTDDTSRLAREAGGVVRQEPLRGKGNVVRRMFADIEADVYVLVDGDDTYDANMAPVMIERLLEDTLDMVSGVRVSEAEAAYRSGHRFGNRMLTGVVASIFGNRLSDMLSGYRVFSRRFVKSFPALSAGFEIETEFSIHALQLGMPLSEVATRYKERPEGSSSKLKTYRDGFRILRSILLLVRAEKPFAFFAAVAVVFAGTSIALGTPVVFEYFQTGLVPRIPTALLAAALMILSFLSLTCGLILETVSRGRVEVKRLAYISVPIRFSRIRKKVASGGDGDLD
jgi:glycosyltransferase involved in cell wall biosynthesis